MVAQGQRNGATRVDVPRRPTADEISARRVYRFLGSALAASVLFVVAGSVGLGWGWGWTGIPANGSLWSWFSLLLLPVVLAMLPFWLKTRSRYSSRWHIGLLIVGALSAVVIVGGYVYRWPWVGFYGHPDGDVQLWEWLTTLVLPAAILLIPFWLGPKRSITRRLVLVAGTALGLFAVVVVCGYVVPWKWTGFADRRLWDWVKDFLVPFALPVALLMLDTEALKAGGGATPNPTGSGSGGVLGRFRAPGLSLGTPVMTVAVAVLGLVLGGAGVWLVSRSSAATTGIEPTSSGSASASASSAASRTSSATPRTTESSPSPAWQELEGPTSGPFKGASAAAYRGAIWVAGGMGTVVRVYNPGTRGWGNGPPLPAARRLGVLVAAGRRLYYIGGLTDDDRQGRPTVFYLDSPSGTWREGPRLPEGRYSGAGAWDGRRIVFAGGAAATGAGRRARSDVWALVSGRWTPIQRLPNPREHLAAATDGDGTTWFVGGTDVPSRTMSAEVDEVQGSRVIIVGRLQRRVQGLSALWTAESGVCAIGGSTAQPNVVPTRPVDTVGCLGGHAWPHLPRAMYLPASAILAGKAYVITGHQMFLLHFRS